MNDRIKVVSGDEKQKILPKEGDVFYFHLNDDRFGYGLVSQGEVDVGPFKNAIIIYVYNYLTPSLCENVVLNKNNLLLSPMITDASCWKAGYFETFKNIKLNGMDLYPEHYFKNPVINKIYNCCGEVVTSPLENIPIGEESIQFQKSIIRAIENAIN